MSLVYRYFLLLFTQFPEQYNGRNKLLYDYVHDVHTPYFVRISLSLLCVCVRMCVSDPFVGEPHPLHCITLQHTATHCKTLLYTTLHIINCSTMLHTATHCNQKIRRRCASTCSVLQCAAVCCSVLQCVAVCCSVLQCVAVCCNVLQCVAVCCSMLQHVAMSCSVLQSVLHQEDSTLMMKCVAGVAVCCSTLQ